jgi:hypothetical protein
LQNLAGERIARTKEQAMRLSVVMGAVVGAAVFAAGCAMAAPDESIGTTAAASSVHLKGGPSAEPSFHDLGLALRATGDLSGLGNGDVLVNLEATADVTSTCTNQGGNQAPGQNPAPLTVTGSEAIPKGEIKNGTTPFAVTTVAPDATVAGAPGCPNGNWTESIDDLAFTSATITVQQAGTTVLTIYCTIDPPSADGAIPKGDVSCTQS